MSLKISSGVFRGDKIEYSDGVGCCIWVPFPIEHDVVGQKMEELGLDDDSGIAFDFSFDDIDDLIGLLNAIKQADATKFEGEVTNELPIYADERVVKDEPLAADWPPGVARSTGKSDYEKKKNFDMRKVLDMMGLSKFKKDVHKTEEKMMEPVVEAIKEFNEKYDVRTNVGKE